MTAGPLPFRQGSPGSGARAFQASGALGERPIMQILHDPVVMSAEIILLSCPIASFCCLNGTDLVTCPFTEGSAHDVGGGPAKNGTNSGVFSTAFPAHRRGHPSGRVLSLAPPARDRPSRA